jgi:hypothetical protein
MIPEQENIILADNIITVNFFAILNIFVSFLQRT